MQLLPHYDTVNNSTAAEAARLAQEILTDDDLSTDTPVIERAATLLRMAFPLVPEERRTEIMAGLLERCK